MRSRYLKDRQSAAERPQKKITAGAVTMVIRRFWNWDFPENRRDPDVQKAQEFFPRLEA